MYTILVCDDDRDIRGALRRHLSAEGYRVLEAENGGAALELLARESADLVLMDVMMPGTDGVAATMELRKTMNVPVIFLTAKSEDADKILGLTVGADDYITKPFNYLELLARVKAQLRRSAWAAAAPAPVENAHIRRCGGLELDDAAKRVMVDGEEISLTPKEFDILKLLMEQPGRVFSSEEIYRQVWKEAPLGAANIVPVHIRHLREKIETNPAEPRFLRVIWGRGYKLEVVK